MPTAQELADYQRYSLDIFIHRVQTIDQYVDDPTALRERLNHIFINIAMCARTTEFYDARLQLIDKLNSAPIRYGMSQQWDQVLCEALNTIREDDHYYRGLVYGLRARIAYDRVYPKQARDWGEIALHHAQLSNDAKLITEMTQTLCYILMYHFGEHEEAIKLIEQTEVIINGLNTPVPLNLYITLASALRFMGNIHQARAIIENMAEIWLKKPEITIDEQIIILNNRGLIRWADGAYALAEADLIEVAQAYEKRQELSAAAGSYGNLGLCYWSWGKLPKAHEIYAKAIEFAKEADDVQREMKLIGNQGLVYLAQGRFDWAEAHLREHIRRAESLGAEREVKRARGNLAQLNLFRYDLSEVEKHLKEALNDHKYPNEANGENQLLLVLYYQRVGNIEQARLHLDNVWQICDDGEHTILTMLAYRLSAEVYPEHAEDHLQKALQLARQHERRLDTAGCLFQLAKVCDNEAYREEAYQLLREMDALYWLEDWKNASLMPLII